MKIGIITQPLQYNYGGILQAYALQTVLERMGHEASIVRQSRILPMPGVKEYAHRVASKLIHTVYHHAKVEVFREKTHNAEFKAYSPNIWRFVEEYIHSYMVPVQGYAPEGVFDCLIVGSDQVWRPGYNTCGIQPMFLSYAQNWEIKRVAYAASFGTDNLDEFKHGDIEACKRFIQKFDGVSVREESGVGLCRDYLDYDKAQWVLDPTMLLQKEDYVKLIDNWYNERVLTTYILDETPEKLRVIDDIKKRRMLPQQKMFTKEHNYIQPLASIEEWLNAFRKCEFACVDSFHGTVFSILFQKPFVVFGNVHRGNTRMESLLKICGLEDRLVSNYDEYLKIKDLSIDYESVQKRINAMREKSIDFLENSLD